MLSTQDEDIHTQHRHLRCSGSWRRMVSATELRTAGQGHQLRHRLRHERLRAVERRWVSAGKMAQTYIDNYFSRYSGVKKFIDNTIAQAKKNKSVTTLLGRKRNLDDINASNANVRGFAERMAINTPIQGSAADLIKLAMINMEKALMENNMSSKMLLSVHDEIIFEVPEHELDKLMGLAKDVMENVFELRTPLKVNIDKGNNWAEAH